jgi:hypothetical protein
MFELSREMTYNERVIFHSFTETRHGNATGEYDYAPSLYCQWVLSNNNKGIEWDGGEKFYAYVEWLEFIIDKYLNEWGIEISGSVRFRGERFDDVGTITVIGEKVQVDSW